MRSGRHNLTLGVVSTMPAAQADGKVFVHFSFGRIVDELARHYDRVILCSPSENTAPGDGRDYAIRATNLLSVPQPDYRSSLQAMRRPWRIVRAYARVCRLADHIFVRGMVPLSGCLYLSAFRRRRAPCHWIVGDPIGLLRSHRRAGRVMDALSLAYAWADRLSTLAGRWLTRGSFVCNGEALGRIFRSPRTSVAVSTTLEPGEFYQRPDTCLEDPVRILCVGYVRPEKGLEYLLEAMARVKTPRPWRLRIIGPWEKFSDYKARLDDLALRLHLTDRVAWEGYVPYGPAMWQHLRESDIFVLPTLSEGTPRVLVEARASSLPVVATNVGGIPTSVTSEYDGLLVAPKDPDALAGAIDRVISDGELRRRLIRNGLATAQTMTVDRFAQSLLHRLGGE